MAMGVPLGLAIAMSARTAAARAAALARGSRDRAHRLLHGLARRDPGARRRSARRPGDHARPRALARQAGPGRGGRGDPRQGRPAARRAARRRQHARSRIARATSCWSSCSSWWRGSSSSTSARASPAAAAWRPRCRRCAPFSAAVAWGAVVVAVLAGASDVRRLRLAGRPLAGVQGAADGDCGSDVHRLSTFSGEGRYKFWVSSVHAFETAPLVAGIGAGSFENWWEAHATRARVRPQRSLALRRDARRARPRRHHAAAGADRPDHRRGRTRRPPSDRTAAGAPGRRHRRLRRVRRRGRCRLALAGDGPARLLPAARRGRPRAARARRTTARRGAGGGVALVGLSVVASRRSSAYLWPARRSCGPVSRPPPPTSSIPPCTRRARRAASSPSHPRRCCSVRWSWSCAATSPARRPPLRRPSARSPPTGARRSCSHESRPNAAT